MLFKKKKVVNEVKWPLNPGNPDISLEDYENTKDFFNFFDSRDFDSDFFNSFNYIRIIHRDLGGIKIKSAAPYNDSSEKRVFEKLKKILNSKHSKIKWDEHSLIFYDEENHAITVKDNIFYAWTGFSINLSKIKWLTTDGSKLIFQNIDDNEVSEDFGVLNYYINDAIQYYLIERCRMTFVKIGCNIDGTFEGDESDGYEKYEKYRKIFYGGVDKIIRNLNLSNNSSMKNFMIYELVKRYIYTESSRRIIPTGRLDNHNDTIITLYGYETLLFRKILTHEITRKELNRMSWIDYYNNEMPKDLNSSLYKELNISSEIVTKLGKFIYNDLYKKYVLESDDYSVSIYVRENSFGKGLSRFKKIENNIDEYEKKYRYYVAEQICKDIKDWERQSTLEKGPKVEELAEMLTYPGWEFRPDGSYVIVYDVGEVFFGNEVWVTVNNDDSVRYVIK